MEFLSKILYDLRTNHRFTQDYVARKLNVTQAQYSKLERGDKDLLLKDLVTLSGLYRMDAHSLLETILTGRSSLTDLARHHVAQQRSEHESIALEAQKILTEEWKLSAFKFMRLYVDLCQKHGIECASRDERHAFTVDEAGIIRNGTHIIN